MKRSKFKSIESVRENYLYTMALSSPLPIKTVCSAYHIENSIGNGKNVITCSLGGMSNSDS